MDCRRGSSSGVVGRIRQWSVMSKLSGNGVRGSLGTLPRTRLLGNVASRRSRITNAIQFLLSHNLWFVRYPGVAKQFW